jgi:hypothetical protein
MDKQFCGKMEHWDTTKRIITISNGHPPAGSLLLKAAVSPRQPTLNFLIRPIPIIPSVITNFSCEFNKITIKRGK